MEDSKYPLYFSYAEYAVFAPENFLSVVSKTSAINTFTPVLKIK